MLVQVRFAEQLEGGEPLMPGQQGLGQAQPRSPGSSGGQGELQEEVPVLCNDKGGVLVVQSGAIICNCRWGRRPWRRRLLAHACRPASAAGDHAAGPLLQPACPHLPATLPTPCPTCHPHLHRHCREEASRLGFASGVSYGEFAHHAGLPAHMNWRNHIKVLQGSYCISLSSWLVQRGLLPPSMARPPSAGKSTPRNSISAGLVSLRPPACCQAGSLALAAAPAPPPLPAPQGGEASSPRALLQPRPAQCPCPPPHLRQAPLLLTPAHPLPPPTHRAS
jgi:hypothetical protein